ncbi:hypothetical protein CEUSTIGMA_g10397.t1 [Chlamydomonas eustigma]|uniref:Uncharacterized protein n=1 Tax=Chlamydomonas eustigma TaxID=1157962 RepID=A0A250XJJ1_9CHLO|nr:hypothetical protein CEUSTIGMA_g10397.t1 [Chlamydomonas eustigma]|eukprot:GAX82970.1 hypothetical protein CEUSTIGMA_g10397.t1 [Chlamydomonas eustigma]
MLETVGKDSKVGQEREFKVCEICLCRVPLANDGWSVHTAGIRHRRRQLGQTFHGSPETIVVSLFEAEHILHPKGSHNLITRDPAMIKFNGPINMNGRSSQTLRGQSELCDNTLASSASCTADLEKIVKLLLRELPHHLPLTSPSYSPAISQLSMQALQKEYGELLEQLKHLSPKQNSSSLSRRELNARKRGCWTFKNLPAAAVACLALVAAQRTDIRELLISVPFKPAGGHSAEVYTCALCVLLPQLRCHPSLTRLSIRIERGEYLEIMMQNRFEVHRSVTLGPPGQEGEPYFMTSLKRLWGLVLSKLTDLIQARPALRHVVIHTPPHLLHFTHYQVLAEAAEALVPARCNTLRLEVLKGGHDHRLRSGAAGSNSSSSSSHCARNSSLLQLLPVTLMQEILDEALPLGPCKLDWNLQQWMPGGGSSEDGDSGSSSSDYDDDDSCVHESSSKSEGDEEDAGGKGIMELRVLHGASGSIATTNAQHYESRMVDSRRSSSLYSSRWSTSRSYSAAGRLPVSSVRNAVSAEHYSEANYRGGTGGQDALPALSNGTGHGGALVHDPVDSRAIRGRGRDRDRDRVSDGSRGGRWNRSRRRQGRNGNHSVQDLEVVMKYV